MPNNSLKPPPQRRRYSKRFTTTLFSTTNKTSKSTIQDSMIKSTNNTGTLSQLLKSTIKIVNDKLRILNKNAKEQKAKEEDAALKIQKAVRHMIDKKIGKSILDDKLRELREEKILNQERLEKIDIVQNALNELLIIQKNITEGIIKESDGIINRIKDIFGIVDSSSREINTSIGIRSRGRSSRENSSKVIRSIGRSSRENSSKVIRSIGRSSRENSSRVSKSRENSSKTYAVIDRSELMMNNLKTILKFLSNIWSDYIIYDDENNTGAVKLIIKLPGASYDISYNNITELANNFKKYYNTISIACYFPCSKDIKELISKLNKSNDEKKSYDTIVELLNQYIKENIKKPEQAKNLISLQEVINSLEKIRGGKLRKVRKTNVIKKRTTKVIRNRKL